MEPCGFVRSLRYVRPIQPRDWKRLRKRTSGTAARTDRTGLPRTIGRWGGSGDLVRQSADARPPSSAGPNAVRASSLSFCPSSPSRRPHAVRLPLADVHRRPAPRRARPTASPGGSAPPPSSRPVGRRRRRTRSSTRSRPRSRRSAACSRRPRPVREIIDEARAPHDADRGVRQGQPGRASWPRPSGCTRRSGCCPRTPISRRCTLDLLERQRGRLLSHRREEAVRRRRGAGRSGPRTRSRSPTSSPTRCRTSTSTSTATQATSVDQGDRASPGWPSSRATPRVRHDLLGRHQHLTAAELAEVLAAAADPAQQAILDRMPPILRETAALPLHDRRLSRRWALQRPGGWRGRRRLSTPTRPTSTEQILHPEKYAAREAPVAVTLPTAWPTDLGPGWTVAARGHVRRVPDGGSGSGTDGGVPPRRPTMPRPAGAATASRCSTGRTAPGRVAMMTAWDTRRGRDGVRGAPRPTVAREGSAARTGARPVSRRHGPLGRRLGDDDATLGKRRRRPGPRRLVAAARRRGRLHRVRRGDPEQPERVRERDPGRARERRAVTPIARARSRRPPARRGRRRGTSSRAPSRRP